jgi:hypothetical protein
MLTLAGSEVGGGSARLHVDCGERLLPHGLVDGDLRSPVFVVRYRPVIGGYHRRWRSYTTAVPE